ncbi:zinc-dependent alcohol dehydrogenase family protein [Limnoglobus roseus]|uniref:Zinc-binding dehydrogenase n=1 Tax=Limnoglobus roseus TaxID=2598579 RepID=A0A5C1A802_9BACT|nr:zinc-dependent alcohol dehydrogenase family protein [Limnoglobus roseus]QEL14625.1 zinc-binding dehydrogenase [Limnoglobus roseus]
MRAALFDQPGDPAEVLHVRDIEKPVPRRGEVLVRMIASPVNPSDLMFIRGVYGLKPKLPATPGFEGVGVVEGTGGGLLGFLRKGKRVAVLNDGRGNWGEYTVTTARQVIPVSADIPDAQAATFFVNPMTAVALTQDVLAIPPGSWLLQTAAAGALGKMIVRLGRKFGFRTINIVRRPEQVDELKALGADAVFTTNDDLAERVKAATGGVGVPFIVDPVGGELASRVLSCLAPGGRMVLYGSLADKPLRIDSRSLLSGGQRIEGFWLGHWVKQQRVLRMLKLIRQVRSLMREGVLTTESVEEFPLDRVREAVARAATPGKGGKVLLRLSGP